MFLTVEGKPCDQSNIGKKVIAFWFKAKQIKLSSTDVREIASSATYDMDVVEKKAIDEHGKNRKGNSRSLLRYRPYHKERLPEVTNY